MIGRLRRTYGRLRLGTRLALGLGALALVVFAVVGTALTTYMRDYLSHQLDQQLAQAQIAQSKSIADHGTLSGKKYYSWFYAVYDVSDGTARLRRPEDPATCRRTSTTSPTWPGRRPSRTPSCCAPSISGRRACTGCAPVRWSPVSSWSARRPWTRSRAP